jgi:hypothetical protein
MSFGDFDRLRGVGGIHDVNELTLRRDEDEYREGELCLGVDEAQKKKGNKKWGRERTVGL